MYFTTFKKKEFPLSHLFEDTKSSPEKKEKKKNNQTHDCEI